MDAGVVFIGLSVSPKGLHMGQRHFRLDPFFFKIWLLEHRHWTTFPINFSFSAVVDEYVVELQTLFLQTLVEVASHRLESATDWLEALILRIITEI